MIEIFITNIKDKKDSKKIKMELLKIDSRLHICIDIEDIDKVLRIEGISFKTDEIIKTVNKYGFQCEVMI